MMGRSQGRPGVAPRYRKPGALRLGVERSGNRSATRDRAGTDVLSERLGVAPRFPNRPALRAGNRNSLARRRRAAASSDLSLPSCGRGSAPAHTHPPIWPAANGVRRHQFLRAERCADPPEGQRVRGAPVFTPASLPERGRNRSRPMHSERGRAGERRPLASSPGGAGTVPRRGETCHSHRAGGCCAQDPALTTGSPQHPGAPFA